MYKKLAILSWTAFVFTGGAGCSDNPSKKVVPLAEQVKTPEFKAPDTSQIPHDAYGEMVRYGRDLVYNTAKYIGPDGTAGKYLGNKMNCSNCHLDGGTRPYGFNFFTSHARYPQYRGRENRVLLLGERINNCIERPHSGTPMPLDAKEMIAIECYIRWVGTNTTVGQHIKGDESLDIDFPDRPADITKGAKVYVVNCQSCHGSNGEGKWASDSSTYN
jgi:thiosulfate dehydrogenase